MEKKQIVGLFLERGLTIDPKGLDYFYENPEQLDVFLEKINQQKIKPTSINLEVIKNTLETSAIKIKEAKIFTNKTISVNDVSRILTERYEKIQKYFSKRIDLVNPISINKISEKTKRFSLIIIVREKDEKDKMLLVEDFTGETNVLVDNTSFNSILCDEVLGMVCEKYDNKIKAINILWPDIPLKREISRTEEDVCCIFLSDLHLEQDFEEKTDNLLKEIQQLNYKQLYVFLFGKNASEKKTLEDFITKLPSNSKTFIIKNNESIATENTTQISSPAILTIEKKINLLLCDGEQFAFYKGLWGDKSPEDMMLELLKKRHLDPVFEIKKASLEDIFIIDTVPDIFVSGNFGQPGMKNYKGTTIISCGSFLSEPVYWIVNLRTRENIKISLA